MQQYVKGETTIHSYGYSSTEPSTEPLIDNAEAPATEVPLSEKAPEYLESIEQGEITPTPTVEQRRFSAPLADWDPAR